MIIRNVIEERQKLFTSLSVLVIILSIAITMVYFYRAIASPQPPPLSTVDEDPPFAIFPKDLE